MIRGEGYRSAFNAARSKRGAARDATMVHALARARVELGLFRTKVKPNLNNSSNLGDVDVEA